ncbi:MAG: hypothetical protein V2A77_07590 [Pseudomonadota bacterium]
MMLDKLKPKDRWLLTLIVVLVAGWLGWMFWLAPVLERSARCERMIARKEKQLSELIVLRARWDTLQARRVAFSKRLNKGRAKDFSLATALQGAAQRAGVSEKVTNTKETPCVREGAFKRRVVEAELSELTLEQLVGYLYEVEGPREMLRVDRLDLRPQANNPMFVDASLAVSCLEAPASSRR